MATATASDGAEIFYRVAGEGPPLLLSTASFATHRHWRDQAERLAHRFRVVTWDYRGHGRSEAPAEDRRFSLEQVVDDLRAVHAAAAGDDPAYVGGLSIGGLVSLCYALAHPKRVRALLLFNTGPGFKKPEARDRWKEMLERAAAKLERVGVAKYLDGERATAELIGLDLGSEAAREAREGILTSSVEGLARFARQVAGPVPNLVDRLAEIDCPTLVLAGAKDAAFERASQVLAARLPRARRVVLEGAGHMMNLDQPGAFAREIELFLEVEPGL